MASRKRELTPKYQVRSQNREASMIRLRARAAAIPANTTKLHDAIKRHIWLQDLTVADLGARLGFNVEYMRRALSLSGANKGKPTRIMPPLLNRICEAVGVDEDTRDRWHTLGAIAVGWDLTMDDDLGPAEREHRFARLYAGGCLCCLMNRERGKAMTPLAPPHDRLGNRVEIHHLNEGGKHGGKRRGHRFTAPLCTWHHRGIIPIVPGGQKLTKLEATAWWGPSWADGSKPFRAEYGDDAGLLAMADAMVGPAADPERVF